jgi:hypothetical protein
MTERDPEPGPDDAEGDDRHPEGPPEVVDAARDEIENPSDETNEG